MDARFDELRNFYHRLDDAMPPSMGLPRNFKSKSSNVCGSCFECCRLHLMMAKHEFEYLDAHLIETYGASPIQWVTCSTPLQDARLKKPVDPTYRCPLYQEGSGCMAYEARPLACRTFGPMHPRQTTLPATCTFTESKPCDSVEEIPLWTEYAEVIRHNRPSPPGYFVSKSPVA